MVLQSLDEATKHEEYAGVVLKGICTYQVSRTVYTFQNKKCQSRRCRVRVRLSVGIL